MQIISGISEFSKTWRSRWLQFFFFPDKDRGTQIQVICLGNLKKLVSIFYCNVVFLSQWCIEINK